MCDEELTVTQYAYLAELRDDDDSLVELEVLTNCCRNNLEHCRWGPLLVEIARSLRGKVIFWKGQLGDIVTTQKWKEYSHPPNTIAWPAAIALRLSRGRGERVLRAVMERTGLTQRMLLHSLWSRGAMWQGSHMSIIRQLTDALVLSAYHGPEMKAVLADVDFYQSVQADIRPMIGRNLFGRSVSYPGTNPSPGLSIIRKGYSDVNTLLQALKTTGIPVVH